MPPPSSRERFPAPPVHVGRTVFAAVILVLGACGAYWNSLDAPFIFDDGPAILHNRTLRQLWPLSGPLSPPTNAGGVINRPLVNLSFALNYAASGLEVRSYRATNIALHALVALVLWAVLRRTLRSGSREIPFVPAGVADRTSLSDLTPVSTARQAESIAFWTALLWAVHPLLTESVVCVVQRNEIIGALFYSRALYAFIRSVHSTTRTARNAWQAAAVASCFAGVASKEIVATAPVLIFLYDRTFVAGTFGGAWRERRNFYLALASSWLLLAWLMLGAPQRGGTVGLGLGVGSWEYLLTQCRALVVYAKLSFWPYPLIVDYGMEVARHAREVWPQGLLVLTALLGTLWALWRRPQLGFVGACLFILLAPSSSFVPLVSQTIAEHRMYLPLVVVIVMLVIGLHRLFLRRAWIAVAALVLAGGGLTWQRNEVYRDEERLWTELLATHPRNPRAHVNLGHYYARKENWSAALQHNAEAIRLLPDYADAHNGLGQALVRTGHPAEALIHFERAHLLSPNNALINFNYGTSLAQAGRLPEAIERLAASLRADPAQPDVHNNLGLALALQGRTAEALETFRVGLNVHPRHAELRANLANQLYSSGDLAGAAAEYARAVEIAPGLIDARRFLARALVRLGRPAEALPHYENLLAGLPPSASLHHDYALALTALGRIDEAITQEEAALRIDPSHAASREHLARLRRG